MRRVIYLISASFLKTPAAVASNTGHAATSAQARPKKTRNAFMQFRSYAIANDIITGCANMSEVSCRAGERWHKMSDEEKAPFFTMAAEEKIRMALGLLGAPAPKRKRVRASHPKQEQKLKRRSPMRCLPDSPPNSSDNSWSYSPTSSASPTSSLAGSPQPFVMTPPNTPNTTSFVMDVSAIYELWSVIVADTRNARTQDGLRMTSRHQPSTAIVERVSASARLWAVRY